MNVASIEQLENKKINKLLWQYALPAIVGVVVNMLYNVVDAIFIGHWVSKDAIVALGVVLPIMNFMAAFGMLIGAGAASRISIYLGMKDRLMAEKIAGTAFVLSNLVIGVVVTILFIYMKPILYMVGADENTYHYARDFLIIYYPGSVFFVLCFNFNSMMRASGYPKKAMITMMIGVVANIILAPIFIKLLGWGMKGAALATTISMIISCVFVMHHFLDRNSYIKLKLSNMRLKWDIIKPILSIGMSPFCMQIAASAIVIFVNYQLIKYGEGSSDGIGAYIIVNRLAMLNLMIVMGLTQGMQPIVGYNYGAKNYIRVKETLLYTIKVGVVIATIGFVLGLAVPKLLVSAFSNDKHLIGMSTEAMRILVLAFPLVGFQIVVGNFFQSVGKAGRAIFLSMTRQILFLIPCLYTLPLFWGIDGVWFSMPICDALSAAVTFVVFLIAIKELNKQIAEQQGLG